MRLRILWRFFHKNTGCLIQWVVKWDCRFYRNSFVRILALSFNGMLDPSRINPISVWYYLQSWARTNLFLVPPVKMPCTNIVFWIFCVQYIISLYNWYDIGFDTPVQSLWISINRNSDLIIEMYFYLIEHLSKYTFKCKSYYLFWR